MPAFALLRELVIEDVSAYTSKFHDFRIEFKFEYGVIFAEGG